MFASKTSRMRLSRLAALALVIAFAVSLQAQEAGKTGQDHLGNDADARVIGLPLYPGAQPRAEEKDSSNANLAIFTQAFGVKLLVARYNSGDAPDKIAAYYRDKLKKYGRVIECRSHEHDGDIHVHTDKKNSDSGESKDLKCDSDNTGNVVELKTGTEDNQHVVAIEAAEKGNGSTFALVYVYARGKQGDI